MATTIPDLWPEDIKAEVLPPAAILKAQEGLLALKTHGALQAALARVESERLVQYQLDLIAPSLNFYRERILSVTHERGRYYPVRVTAACFESEPAADAPLTTNDITRPPKHRRAATDEELIRLIGEALRSVEVRSLIQSLVAQAGEVAAVGGNPDDLPVSNGAQGNLNDVPELETNP